MIYEWNKYVSDLFIIFWFTFPQCIMLIMSVIVIKMWYIFRKWIATFFTSYVLNMIFLRYQKVQKMPDKIRLNSNSFSIGAFLGHFEHKNYNKLNLTTSRFCNKCYCDITNNNSSLLHCFVAYSKLFYSCKEVSIVVPFRI